MFYFSFYGLGPDGIGKSAGGTHLIYEIRTAARNPNWESAGSVRKCLKISSAARGFRSSKQPSPAARRERGSAPGSTRRSTVERRSPPSPRALARRECAIKLDRPCLQTLGSTTLPAPDVECR